MANPVCLSPLKFYDDTSKQNHCKSYAYNHISPLVSPIQFIPSFQFVIPDSIYQGNALRYAYLRNAKTHEAVTGNIAQELIETGFSVQTFEGYKVAIYFGLLPIQFDREGEFYLDLASLNNNWRYFSEVFCFTNNLNEYLEIEYWNKPDNFYIKDGIVVFPDNFHFKLLLNSEVGKPEYNFEEEGTKRLGYNFIESQVSKKIYRFNAVVPEFICDAARIIRLCNNKIIRTNGNTYDAMSFEMSVDWQTQGDLASINCEFETDNVIVNLSGFVPDELRGGDFNADFNDDFDNQ